MTKYPVFLFAIALFIQGCAPSAAPTDPPAASETPLPALTATPFPLATPTAPAALSSLPGPVIPDGLGVQLHYEFFPDTYMPIEQYILLKEANIGIVRDDLWPGGACGGPPWCFEYFEKLVSNMALIGVRVVFNLQDYENAQIGTEEGRKAFAEFAAAAAEQMKGNGVIYEIWNEPELDHYWKPYANPGDYALLVDETARAIRAADPGAVILGPSVATLSTVFGDGSWRFLNSLGETGTLSSFDAVDVHLYNGGSPESQIENLRKLRRLVDSYSPDRRIPITSTEWGYTTGGEYYRHRSNAEEQPKYVARSFLVKAAHEIKISLWYDWKNDDWDPNGEAEAHFGLITEFGEPKPAYQAFRTLTTTLDGHRFLRRLSTQSSHDYLLLFGNGDSGVLAAWTITEPHTLTFPNATGGIQSIGMFGKSETLQSGEAGLSVQLSDSPQYLLLPDGFLGSEGVFWNPEGTFFKLDDTSSGEIPVRIENPSDQEQAYDLQATLNGDPIGATQVTLGPNESTTAGLPVTVDVKTEDLDFLVQVTLADQETAQTAWVWLQR